MLKLDLLPAHYAVARRNKKAIFLSIPLLVGVALLWMLVGFKMANDIKNTQAEYDDTKTKADAVRKTQDETKARQADLDPIAAKVKFVQDADTSGLAFWDRFHKINQYIYDRALVRNFSITPPGSVTFSAELTSTEDAGRFILNLIRCPFITGISISGTPGVSGAIEGAGGAAAPGGAPGGGGPPGAPGGMPGGMPGMPGAPPGGMPGAPPGGAPGGAAPAAAGTAQAPIVLSVTATLVESIAIPTPPVPAPPAGADAGAGGPGGPGGPGAAPGGPGGPGGGAPGGPGGPAAGGAKKGGAKKSDSGDDSGGSGGGGLKKKGGGEEA